MALERDVAVAEADLRDAQAERDRLGATLDAVPEAVVTVDLAGQVVFRNPAAERFHGARHADAVAEAAIDRLLGRAVEGRENEEELVLIGPPRRVLHVRAATLRSGGAIAGAAVFVRDITELRRVESMRRDFVANVSHELKTPMGALALLAETIAAEHDPQVMHSLASQVLAEADRLGRIVDDLLELSLVEAQDSPAGQSVTVEALIGEAIERVRQVASARGIPLHLSSSLGRLVVACDPAQVVSAITNLLDNAVKYSDAGARVEIEARGEEQWAVIEVRDRGIGIPTKDRERIFERFYRVDRARSRATGGTGLGLSIVRHVVDLHGGDVTVESREGEGSTFRIRLPRAGDDRSEEES